MKIAVVGAGGVGGYFGGLLARGGQEVTFLARGEHLQAIRARGLRVVSSTHGDFVISPARAESDPARVGPVEYVLVAVKTFQLEAAAASLSPLSAKAQRSSRSSTAPRPMTSCVAICRRKRSSEGCAPFSHRWNRRV